jgi:hypothetical protein
VTLPPPPPVKKISYSLESAQGELSGKVTTGEASPLPPDLAKAVEALKGKKGPTIV